MDEWEFVFLMASMQAGTDAMYWIREGDERRAANCARSAARLAYTYLASRDRTVLELRHRDISTRMGIDTFNGLR